MSPQDSEKLKMHGVEIESRLHQYRTELGIRVITLSKARESGWHVDDIHEMIHPYANSIFDLICEPWEQDGQRLTKVEGFTFFIPGQWGDDPPPHEEFDGKHQRDSLFVVQSLEDTRNPYELFKLTRVRRAEVFADILAR